MQSNHFSAHYLLLLLFISGVPFWSNCQPKEENKPWDERVYKNTIHTVLLYKSGWELSMPIIKLNSGEKLTLVFDEIGKQTNSYSYTIVHCKPDWTRSELDPMEYLDGHFEGNISNFELSKNTMVNYINYQLDFPTEDFNILVSGNYIIKVFEEDNPEKPVLEKRFYVFEQMADIKAKIEQLKVLPEEGMNQQLNFSIEYQSGKIINPLESFSYAVIKNNEFSRYFDELKPSSISGKLINYQNIRSLAFAGGNEYRYLDLKNFKFISGQIEKIEKRTEAHHVFLKKDESRAYEKYNLLKDINGRKLIKLEGSDKSHIMADYCYVNFELVSPSVVEPGDFYIFGGISSWSLNDASKMDYDKEHKRYMKKLLVKQGYYNYIYLFKSGDKLFSREPDRFRCEGNHFQTENEYHLFAYYKSYRDNYYRLIGYTMVNSTN